MRLRASSADLKAIRLDMKPIRVGMFLRRVPMRVQTHVGARRNRFGDRPSIEAQLIGNSIEDIPHKREAVG